MRFAFVILSLAVIAAGVVRLRRDEVLTRHEIQRLQGRQLLQRRRLWDLDVRLGALTAVNAVTIRAEEMGLTLVAPHGWDYAPHGSAQATRTASSYVLQEGAWTHRAPDRR